MPTRSNEVSSYPFSPEIPELLQRHFEAHIYGSGISIEVARERGYKSILGRKRLEDLGFSPAQRRTPGLLLPVHAPDGSVPFHQYRPDSPRENSSGKPIKYETPPGTQIRIDVPLRCQPFLGNPQKRLWITEGIKKADALASRGEVVADLLGVWNFKGQNEFGGTTLLADFDYIALRGRDVYIVYDSDVMIKTSVQVALDRLTEHLKRKSANVWHVYLPSANGNKVGADDFLLNHSVVELLSLARPSQTVEGRPQGEERKRLVPTSFWVEGPWLAELVKNDHEISYVLFNSETGEVAHSQQVQKEDGSTLVPPERGLIDRNIVLLPSKIVEYEDENTLFEGLQDFITRYVELGDFSPIASLYVLFTWLYDRFTELPYLRFMGDYGTGKSRALSVLGHICYKPFFTFGASTVSPIFRMLDAFRGTMVLDEADHKDSTMMSELTKILNTGFQANIPLLRTEGDRRREVRAYHVFGPKLIATRRPFHDDALESRCLTRIMPHGVRRTDIPVSLPPQFYKEAEDIRNKLLYFRLKNHHKISVDSSIYIPDIEDRLNQIFSPLLSIAKGEFKGRIIEFSRELQERVYEARSQSLEGVTIRAMLDLVEGRKGEITILEVAQRMAGLGLEVSPQKAGRVIKSLGIETTRSTSNRARPYIVRITPAQLQALAQRYGIPVGSYASYGGYGN